jgi:ribonucleoside-diphosphate reductase alpha chain
MPMGDQGTFPLDRPQVLTGKTIKMPTSYGNLYLTVNETGGRPFEVFATLGKSGKDTQAHTEALGRLISLALRTGIPAPEIVNQLKGIGGSQPVWDEDGVILSLPDAIAKCLERALGVPVHTSATDMCPGCGAVLVREEGCVTCHACGYSKC